MSIVSIGTMPTICITEKDISAVPSIKDYKETKALFKDFRIPISTYPEFRSRTALIRWRTETIKQHLT